MSSAPSGNQPIVDYVTNNKFWAGLGLIVFGGVVTGIFAYVSLVTRHDERLKNVEEAVAVLKSKEVNSAFINDKLFNHSASIDSLQTSYQAVTASMTQIFSQMNNSTQEINALRNAADATAPLPIRTASQVEAARDEISSLRHADEKLNELLSQIRERLARVEEKSNDGRK